MNTKTATGRCPIHHQELGGGLPPCRKCGMFPDDPRAEHTFVIHHREGGGERHLILTRAQAHDIATQLLGQGGLGLNFHLWGGHLGGDDLGTQKQARIAAVLADAIVTARQLADTTYDVEYREGFAAGLESALKVVKRA